MGMDDNDGSKTPGPHVVHKSIGDKKLNSDLAVVAQNFPPGSDPVETSGKSSSSSQ